MRQGKGFVARGLILHLALFGYRRTGQAFRRAAARRVAIVGCRQIGQAFRRAAARRVALVGLRQTGQAFRRAAARRVALVGCRQIGQAFRQAAARRPTFLLAEKRGPKMRPWRVGRAVKQHDCAIWLRGLLTSHPCAGSELARIPSGHPAGLFCATSPPRNGMNVKGTQQCCVVRHRRMLVNHPPVPVGKCWTDQSLAGRARDRADCVAGAGMRLQHNPVSACVVVRLHRTTDRPSGRIFGPRFSARRKVGRRAAARRDAGQIW